ASGHRLFWSETHREVRMGKALARTQLREQRVTRSLLRFCVQILVAASLTLTAHAQSTVYGSVRGGAVPLPRDEISTAEPTRIKAAISVNIDALQRSGRLPAVASKRTPTKSLPAVLFQWPLQLVPGHPEPTARNVIAFVDHDMTYPGQVLDYSCGTRSYD